MYCCKKEMKIIELSLIGNSKIPHYYCPLCEKHNYNGINYTKERWFFLINKEGYNGI